LLSALSACIQGGKNGITNKAIIPQVTNFKHLKGLQSYEKAMGLCTAQCKMPLFCGWQVLIGIA